MGRIVVDVMPKPEILDPQGQALAAALPRLGLTGFTAVRQGKRFELEVDGEVTAEVLEAATRAATTLLSNPVIEDVVRVAAAAPSHAADVADDATGTGAPHDPAGHDHRTHAQGSHDQTPDEQDPHEQGTPTTAAG